MMENKSRLVVMYSVQATPAIGDRMSGLLRGSQAPIQINVCVGHHHATTDLFVCTPINAMNCISSDAHQSIGLAKATLLGSAEGFQ